MKTNGCTGNFIKLLSQDDRLLYQSLIVDSFSNTAEFKAHKNTLRWTQTDDHYYVLGLFHHFELVAFLRLETILSKEELLYKVDEPSVEFDTQFPIGYLAKAGTCQSQKNQGWNSLLRYHALQIFLKAGLGDVIGVIAQDSARQRTMQDIGYQFYKKKLSWNGNFASERTILIGVLKKDHVLVAIEKLQQKIGFKKLSHYPLLFKVEQFQTHGRTKIVFPWSHQAKKSA